MPQPSMPTPEAVIAELFEAVGKNDAPEVKALVEGPIKRLAEHPDPEGRTPVEVAAALLNSPNKSGETAAHVAARLGHAHAMEALPTFALTASNLSGQKPVHVAAMHGKAQVCEVLIGRGVILDGADRDGNTPLHLAAANGDAATIKVLLSSPGVNPRATNTEGLTPLQVASRQGNRDAEALLAPPGATPTAGSQWQQVLSAQTVPALPGAVTSAAPKAPAGPQM